MATTPVLDTIETPRLSLRPLGEADAVRLAAVLNDEAVVRQVASWPYPLTALHMAGRIVMANARYAAAGDSLHYGVALRDSDLIGTAGARLQAGGRAVIGYMLGRPWWGRGYGGEAVGALVEALVRRGVGAVEAEAFADNPASIGVLRKLGFKDAAPADGRAYSLGRLDSAPVRRFVRPAPAPALAA